MDFVEIKALRSTFYTEVIEKHNEHGLDLRMLFIDFKQAFDSISRKRLSEAIDKIGIAQN